MRVSEPIKKSGYFWLPGKADNRLPGVLHITETGEATLDVIGVFADTLTAMNMKDLNLGRVVGEIENGALITLEDCFYKNTNIRFGGISTPTIFANLVLIGAKYDEGESISFSKLSFSVEGLDEWLAVSELRIEQNSDDDGVSIQFNPPKEIPIQLPDEFGLKFHFAWTLPDTQIVTEAKITQKAYISLTSQSLRSIDEFLAAVLKVTRFLCFATDETVSVDSATAYSYELTEDIGNGKKQEAPIKIYYQSVTLPDVKPKIHWRRMLFRYSQIASQLEMVMTKLGE
jgi:hypothetical protein